MIEPIRRLRAAATIQTGDNHRELNALADDLEHWFMILSRAMDGSTIQEALAQVNGIFSRAKDRHLKITKHPLVPAGRLVQRK